MLLAWLRLLPEFLQLGLIVIFATGTNSHNPLGYYTVDMHGL